jgi:hypothetical protein
MRSVCIALLVALIVSASAAPTPFARRDPLALRAAVPEASSVSRYGKFELTLDLAATFDNPFDPANVDIWASFTSPQGRTVRVNGFLDQPHTRKLDGRRELIEPSGEPAWKIRFTPDTEGVWRYRVFARDRSGTVNLPEAAFTATASTNAGFIRRSERNPRGFAHDNGQPFFAIGENVCWGGQRGSFDYDDWLPALAKSGGNWIRIWMSSWNCALEWSRESRGDWRSGKYLGVGAYSLDNAWKLDTILDVAEQHGIAVMLCFGTYGEFKDGGYFGEGQWKANPYNATNGGPCLKPEEFWTNTNARQLYRQRLRYLSARYGWRTSIQSWEFWNEQPAPAPWVGEMARFLKGTGEFAGQAADPLGHLVTTTYGNADVWKIPEIDFSQSHHYGMGNEPDHAPVIHKDARDHFRFGKPHLMGEFGIDWRGPDNKYDPDGKAINLHNGLWASALSGNAGGAMTWWWDSYVHPKNLYAHFTPLRKFAAAVPWTAGEWKPLNVEVPTVREALPEGQGLTLPAKGEWGRSAATEFNLSAERGAGGASLPKFLYSPAKPAERTTPVFRFDFDRAGRFAVKVDTVSDLAKLRFVLDGKTAGEFTLSARPPKDPAAKPDYEKTELNKQWSTYQARFGKDYGIDVPAGKHALRLEVTEGDWASVESYTLTGFATATRALPLNLYGLLGPDMALLWAQNSEHHWKNVFEKKPIAPVGSTAIELRGLKAGDWTVEWWDTWRGAVVRMEPATSTGGTVRLRLPDLETDVAARVIRGVSK